MKNHLSDQTSPYLLQHAENPVDWYPWGEEAFQKAKREDKPIFLSIGYSACHWCHVMARECFENEETAELLNRGFVSVKVDREERPDVDHVYLDACTLFSGSGGWPASIFLTPDKKPFFAGTYFPKQSAYGMIGFDELLKRIREKWLRDRAAVEKTGELAARRLRDGAQKDLVPARGRRMECADSGLIKSGVQYLRKSFDRLCGGFGNAPKFPMAHNILFLLEYYEKSGDAEILEMAEKTLTAMYRGGLYDHIGFGFSRYSTDRYFLVPHFEKMLYDNALLIFAYIRAYSVTGDVLYRSVAEPDGPLCAAGNDRIRTEPFTARRTQTAQAGRGIIISSLRRKSSACLERRMESASQAHTGLRKKAILKEKASRIFFGTTPGDSCPSRLQNAFMHIGRHVCL